ncbi:LysR family transcriptional regulator [Acinetobacter sp. YH16032]|uniref:LysR family transcriptional regulator n=1 Tax=Acinetobacter sp. YH16032 TaxID=2601181 RepID=UPI0015D3229D|nr:LysR family transcriptional regulator [Acinetobacter sp. YH16032]
MNIIHQESVDLSAFSHIDINLYPLFIAIYEHQSISKVANLMCITQSAASHALQRLRLQLKDDLFIRSGIKMVATPFSHQIYPRIKETLIAIQHISTHHISFDPLTIQSIRIAIHDEIEPLIFPQLIRHFRDLGLATRFQSIKLDRNNWAKDLLSQQLDLVVDLQQKVDEKIYFNPLVNDRFVICGLTTIEDLEQYKHAQHIGVSSRHSGVLIEDLHFKKLNIQRDIFLRCQHYSTALQILKEYPDTLLTLPFSILKNLKLPQDLKISELPVEFPLMKMGIYWNSQLASHQKFEYLISEINKIFA